MSEDVEGTEEDGVKFEVVTEEEVTPDEVAAPEKQYATVDDVKQWEKDRVENAVDFEVPGTGKWFKIASVDMNALYKLIGAQMAALGPDGDKAAFAEIMGDAVVQSAVVLPKLDDAAVAMLKRSDNTLYQAIYEKCQEISKLESLSQGMEDFF